MHEKYRETLLSLSKAIEEIRGVFLNLNEKNNDIGLFPFEPIKDCYGLIKDLDPICGKQLTEEQRRKVRHQITALWKDVRKELLKEFDREMPTFPHCHWVQPEKSEVYDRRDIPKKVT